MKDKIEDFEKQDQVQSEFLMHSNSEKKIYY